MYQHNITAGADVQASTGSTTFDPPSRLGLYTTTMFRDDSTSTGLFNSREYYSPASIHSISHSTSLSTVALSSSFSGSLASSSSSAYSLSTIDSDVELGVFVNDNYHATHNQDHTLSHQLYPFAPANRIPLSHSKRRPARVWDAVKLRVVKTLRRARGANALQLTPWECAVYVTFGFYLWVLLSAFAGDARMVRTCASLSNFGNQLNTSSTVLSSSMVDSGGILHEHLVSGREGQAVIEYVAREHIISPTSHHHVP
ncbi:hypothetical protein BC835DRAFT_1332368 [Cytidiella melzeri]|nr:hypothetical protein BC835DRAFT_1332368 [Cytidiella melzeri]